MKPALASEEPVFDAPEVKTRLPLQMKTNLLPLMDLLALTFHSHRVLP